MLRPKRNCLNSENYGSKLLRNVGNYWLIDTVLHARGHKSSIMQHFVNVFKPTIPNYFVSYFQTFNLSPLKQTRRVRRIHKASYHVLCTGSASMFANTIWHYNTRGTNANTLSSSLMAVFSENVFKYLHAAYFLIKWI